MQPITETSLPRISLIKVTQKKNRNLSKRESAKTKKKKRKNGIDCSEHVTKKIDIGEIIGEINIKSNKKMKEIKQKFIKSMILEQFPRQNRSKFTNKIQE